jgi:hypothetical protein
VHEDRHPEALGLGEEAEEPAVGQRSPGDVRGDLNAGQAGLASELREKPELLRSAYLLRGTGGALPG